MSRSPVSSMRPVALHSESWWRRRLHTAVVFVGGVRAGSLLRRIVQPTPPSHVGAAASVQRERATMVLHEESQLRVLFRFIHHEMTSATTGLLAYLAFIAADPADEVAVALRATITKLHALSQRMVVLSQDGQAALRREYVDLRAVIVSETAQLRTQGAHLQITTCMLDAPALVWADPTLLAMAVGTALRNAAEAYDPLTVTAPIMVRLTVTATAAELTIADQGPGFPMELLTAIAAARPVLGWTTKAHGSGTGVSLILGVAQLHGGQATFCNRPEGGASMTITLPLAASASDGALPDAAPAERCP